MKKFLAFTMAAAMTLSLAACGGGSSSGSNTSADGSGSAAFKLGGTGPLTGDASIYGLAAQRGAQIAVDEINAEGGAIQFELKYEDDVNDPEKAVNAYNALKEWGMQISLGSVTTQPCIATSSYNFADSIFALTPSASSPDVISGKDNVYQMCFSDPNQGTASAKYISEQKLGEKVFIIWKSDDNYSTGIKDAGADLLFLPIYYDAASLILTQANAMGYAPKFFGVDGMDGILTQANFDTSLAEGVMLLTPFNADDEDEATQHFVKAYQEKYNETPIQFAADAYDCVYAYKQALETAGCTPDMSAADINAKLKETFPTITFTGLTGDGAGITWDSTGAVSKSPKGMVIRDGAYVGMD